MMPLVSNDRNIQIMTHIRNRNPPFIRMSLCSEIRLISFPMEFAEYTLLVLSIADLDTMRFEATLMTRTITIRITPSSNRADWARDPVTASGSWSAIVPVSVLMSENTFQRGSGITGEFPVSISTAMVSPIALPMPSMKAAEIPDIAAGTTTLVIDSHFVAPIASDASR